jgi:hypothetical protein
MIGLIDTDIRIHAFELKYITMPALCWVKCGSDFLELCFRVASLYL